MNMHAVTGRLAIAGDLENAVIEIGLLHVWGAVGRRALPAVADSLDAVAVQFAVESVLKNQRALLLKPGCVVTRGHGRLGFISLRRGQRSQQEGGEKCEFELHD